MLGFYVKYDIVYILDGARIQLGWAWGKAERRTQDPVTVWLKTILSYNFPTLLPNKHKHVHNVTFGYLILSFMDIFIIRFIIYHVFPMTSVG